MDRPPDHHSALLVSCSRCERLHEPRSALDSNPICAGCAEKLRGAPLTGLDHRPSPDGEAF